MMHALTFHGVRDVRHERVDEPRVEAPTDVLLQVSQAGLCGSDLHPYRGHERGLDPGCVMGHECVGTVIETGAAVTGFRRGDRVLSPFTTSCGGCFYCRRGLSSRCVQGQLLGWVEGGVGLHGAQAERVRVPLAEGTLIAIPEGISDDQALLLADVLPTGFFCAERALEEAALTGVGAGVYAVVGLGPVGLTAVWAARALGARELHAIDPVPERRAVAARLGAVTHDPGEAVARVREATEGRGADAVMELVGSPESALLAYELVRPGGTLSMVGVHTAPRFPFSPAQAYDKNLTVRIGRCPARSLIPRLLPLLAGSADDPSSIVTHRVPLAAGPDAYRMFDRREQGCIKLVMTP